MPNIMTEFNEALVAEHTALLEAIEHVLQLHHGFYWSSEDRKMCNLCTLPYPCSTVIALGGAK